MLNLFLFLSAWKRRGIPVGFAKRCNSHLSDSRIIYSSFLLNSFSSGGSQLTQSTCSMEVRFRAFSQFCCSCRYFFWVYSFLFHCWFACLLPHSFRIASSHLYSRLFVIRLLHDCSDKEAWAQLQKDGKNADAILFVSAANSFRKDVVKF